MQSARELEELFVIDVGKDGISIVVGKYKGEVSRLSKEGMRFEMKNVIFASDLRGNLLSVKKDEMNVHKPWGKASSGHEEI